jgi:hypothetical protein
MASMMTSIATWIRKEKEEDQKVEGPVPQKESDLPQHF